MATILPNSSGFKNDFLEVVEGFDALVQVGICPSNTYFGSSMAYGNVFERIVLPAGTVIADLCGGVFLWEVPGRPDLAWRQVAVATGKHPFEKSYGPRRDPWPIENLERVKECEVNRPAGRPGKNPVLSVDDVRADGGVFADNGMDLVVDRT